MHFQLAPDAITKFVGVEKLTISRRMNFNTSLITDPFSNIFSYSTLKDGRFIRHLRCSSVIQARSEPSTENLLVYVPAYSSDELRIDEPDSLQLEIYLPTPAFDELWQAVGDGSSILLGGRIEGIPPRDQYAPTFEPYEWDTSDKAQHHKEVSEFWFTVLSGTDVQRQGAMQALLSGGQSLSDVVEAKRVEIIKEHANYTQMQRLCLSALEQGGKEAMRLGLSGRAAESLIGQALDLLDTARSATREYSDRGDALPVSELWSYLDVPKTFADGRAGLGGRSIDKNTLTGITRDLIQLPWLRLDEFEWGITNAFVFNEVFMFGEHLMQNTGSFRDRLAYAMADGNLKKMGWAKLKAGAALLALKWGLLAAGMWGVWTYADQKHLEGLPFLGVLTGAFLLLVWLFIGFPIGRRERLRARRAQFDLWMKMGDAHALMAPSSILSPYQIRTALVSAQQAGAIWDGAAFVLLDRAAMRNPPVWIVGY